MRKLNVFDDNAWIATISIIDKTSFLFARSPREWTDMKRLLDAAEKLHEADATTNVLDSFVSMLHSYDYNTELIDE
jgi:hypothetical protein